MALPNKNRLKGKRQFSKVFSETRPAISEHFSVRVTVDRTGTGHRFAIVVPAKIVGLASARNVLRRRSVEALSHILRKSQIFPGIRAVITLRTPFVPAAGPLEQELMSLMKKSGILPT